MPRLRWKAVVNGHDLNPHILAAGASIDAIQTAIDAVQPFGPYNAGGAQQAVTTVTWAPNPATQYATAVNMHSEMVALDASISPPPIWTVNANGQAVALNALPIGGGNYATNLPHCAHCTVMLWMLGLPLGAPTDGRYNLAVNLNYPLPADVFNNLELLVRLLNSNVGGHPGLINLKLIINTFIGTASGNWVLQIGPGVFVTDLAVVGAAPMGAFILDWATEAVPHVVNVNIQHFGHNSLLLTLWKIVWQALYDHSN